MSFYRHSNALDRCGNGLYKYINNWFKHLQHVETTKTKTIECSAGLQQMLMNTYIKKCMPSKYHLVHEMCASLLIHTYTYIYLY